MTEKERDMTSTAITENPESAVIDRSLAPVIPIRRLPWHQALSVPCWCGERHDPWEASDLNARRSTKEVDRG